MAVAVRASGRAVVPCTNTQRHSLVASVRHHQSLVIASAHVRPLWDVEREYILAALGRNNGNRTLTAGRIGTGPAMLFRKLKRYSDGPWSLLLVAEAWARVVEFSTSL